MTVTPTAPAQAALFQPEDVPEPLPAAPSPSGHARAEWNYAHHLIQQSGDWMWKLGWTVASPRKRARQIACTAVAWWPGTERDETRMHGLWKHHRFSPAAEFFYQDGDDLDRYVLRHIKQMPATIREMQVEVFAQIEVRYHDDHDGRLSNHLLMDVLTALCGQHRTQAGETLMRRLQQILFEQIGAKKIA